MTEAESSSVWLPDRPPTLTEIGLVAVFTVAWIPLQFRRFEAIAWSTATIGFLTTVVVLGPIASTSLGKGIEDWGRSVGVGWRVLTLLTVITALIAVAEYSIPDPNGISFALGGICAASAVVWAQLIRFRSVSR